MDDSEVCSHVLAERRSSVSSSHVQSFAVLPPIARRSSVNDSPRPRACRRHSTGCQQRPYGFPGPLPSRASIAGTDEPERPPPPRTRPKASALRTSPVPEDVAESDSVGSGWGTVTKESLEAEHGTRDHRGRDRPVAKDFGAEKIEAYPQGGPHPWEVDLEGKGGERQRTWSLWASESVATNALVPALVTQALSTGLLDATTYADFHTFASNQTGNAILLTVAAVGAAKALVVHTAASFGGFLIGAFVFGQTGHFVGVRKRSWLLLSTFIQTLFLVVAGILLSPVGPRVTALGGTHEWVVIFLFATMSGGQVAMARQSSCQELPTAPMTSTFVDFVADHYLFAGWSDPRAVSRNRRLYYVIVMLGGSFIGAVMHRWCNSWSVVIMAVGVKIGALSLLAIAKPDPSK